jgi:uncharacterized protein (DUF3820 family)
MNAPVTSIALELLPPDLRSRLEALKAKGRGPFGRLQTQEIVNAHLDVLLWLRRQGASHTQLAELLQTLGIMTRQGQPLSAATVSSAISRALGSSGRRNGRHMTRVQAAHTLRRPAQPSPEHVAPQETNSREAVPLGEAIQQTAAHSSQALPQPRITAAASARSARDSPPVVAARQNVRREILLTLLDSSEDQ